MYHLDKSIMKNLITEEYLKDKGWENKPQSAYSEDEIEEGYVDNTLYLRYTKRTEWCQYAFIKRRSPNNEWIMCISDCDKYRVELTVVLSCIEDYECAMNFYNKFKGE